MSLFEFYKISFLVAAFSGGALSLIGKHCYSRGNILEIFLLSQLSLLGNLIAKLWFHSHSAEWSGVLISYILFGMGKLFLYRFNAKDSNRATMMVGGYLFLLSLQYLIIGFFPQLDSHMSLGFFGNMVTATSLENMIVIVTFSLFFIFYLMTKRKINKNTIEINIYNSKDNSINELLLFSIPLVSSLYSLGFLYTMSYLLLPALIIGPILFSERSATIFMMLISVVSSILGLGASIYFERLSTSSLQIFLLFFILCLFRTICYLKNKFALLKFTTNG